MYWKVIGQSVDGLIEYYGEITSIDSPNTLMVNFCHQGHNASKVALEFSRKFISCGVTEISCLPHPLNSSVNSSNLLNSLNFGVICCKIGTPKTGYENCSYI